MPQTKLYYPLAVSCRSYGDACFRMYAERFRGAPMASMIVYAMLAWRHALALESESEQAS